MKGVEPAGAGLGMGMPGGITGPCWFMGAGSGLGIGIGEFDGMTGGMCPGVEGPAAYGDGCAPAAYGDGCGPAAYGDECGPAAYGDGCGPAAYGEGCGCGGAGCGSGMPIPIPCWWNGCVRVLTAADSDGTGNWSPCRRLKSPRRSLRGRTLLYVVGWGWVCGWGWGIKLLVPPIPQELYCALGSWVRIGRKGVLVSTSFGGRGRGLRPLLVRRCRGYSAES
jgi:hypothetical protein